MKTLFIVRHAKSSWKYEGINDHDRPLKKRGINDAYLISKNMMSNFAKPDVFVTSSAIRALHTGLIFCDTFNYPLANLKINRSLYSFSDGYLIKTVKTLDDDYNSAIIFSHDHGINTFVNKYGNKLIQHVPTCGVIGLKLNIRHWKNLTKGKTIFFDFPKKHKNPVSE